MLKSILRASTSRVPLNCLGNASPAFYSLSSVYDPPYLDELKPKIPIYDALNIQMKGHDFAVLESYQKLVHKLARTMDIEVEDSWAVPAKQTKIQRYKPFSTIVESEFSLTTYERNIQVVDLPSTVAPIFLEMIEVALPQGITLTVHSHEEEHDKARYIPDLELKQLKTQLDILGGPITKKK